MVRSHHAAQKRPRRYVLIPDSAHGTNPASAAIAGYQVVSIPSDSSGRIDTRILRERMNEDVACLMLTNPNTLGIFESQIEEISRIVHGQGGLIYMDGANFKRPHGLRASGRHGDRRAPPQSAQDLLDPPRRRWTRLRSGGLP